MNLINDIDKHLLEHEGKPKLHHYPSDAGKCTLQLWNNWHGVAVTDPIELTALWKMAMGNAIHDKIANILTKIHEELHSCEVKMRADIGLEYGLSGRMDDVLQTPEGKLGIEIKTSFGRGIVEIAKTQSPKPEHLGQIALYLKYTDIDRFKLLYIGRDNAYRTEFDFKKGDLDVTPYLEQFAIAEKEEKPKRELKATIVNGEFKTKFQSKKVDYKGDWQCAYCKYRTGCWKDVLAKKGKYIGEELITL